MLKKRKKNSFKQRVEELIIKSGKKKGEICQEIDIAQSMLSTYLKKGTIPSTSIAQKLAGALNTSTDYLLFGTGNSILISEEKASYGPEKIKEATKILKSLPKDKQQEALNYLNYLKAKK